MVDINETYMGRVMALGDKSLEYLTNNNIPINEWIMWDGQYKDGGFHSIHINGLTEDEITEIKMYGFSPL